MENKYVVKMKTGNLLGIDQGYNCIEDSTFYETDSIEHAICINSTSIIEELLESYKKQIITSNEPYNVEKIMTLEEYVNWKDRLNVTTDINEFLKYFTTVTQILLENNDAKEIQKNFFVRLKFGDKILELDLHSELYEDILTLLGKEQIRTKE